MRFHNLTAVERAGGLLHPLDSGEPAVALPAPALQEEVRAAFAALPVLGQLPPQRAGRGSDAGVPAPPLRAGRPPRDRLCASGYAAGPHGLLPSTRRGGRGRRPLAQGAQRLPSNFAFDAKHPEAGAALAEVLEGWDGEEGLLHYAGKLTTLRGREAAAPWLGRLGARGAESRVFFQLGGGQARRERRFADGERLFRAGVSRFPDDVILAQGVMGALLSQDRAGGARGTGSGADAHAAHLDAPPPDGAGRRATLRARPRPRGSHARHVAPAPPCARLIALGEAQARAGQHEEAKASLAEAAALPGRYAARGWRSLGEVHAALGEAGPAKAAAERAARLRAGCSP